jgi:hypothetical protein
MKRLSEVVFILILLIFSWWLMFHTFAYDPGRQQILISTKAWSDFGALLPLIRFFSFGFSWPLQHPLFSGEPIRYHFLFYALVGGLEKIGLPIHLALNIPSLIGFFALLLLIYYSGRVFFGQRLVGFLAVILFLFNSSFSFLDFFRRYHFSDLFSLSHFVSFRPWNDSLITAFWNLNIYTNQRHLAFSFALVLFLVIILYQRRLKLIYFTGFILGVLVLTNQAAFLIACLFVFSFFIFQPSLRLVLFLSFFGIIPWVLFYRLTNTFPALPVYEPGYLAAHPLSITGFIKFWWMNLGLSLITIPLGLLFSPRRVRLFVIPLLIIFIAPSLFRFSADMVNNHKFFNFFVLFGNLYTSWVLVKIWSFKPPYRLVVIPLFALLIAGGIVDIFPVKNDYFIRLPDIKSNPDAQFFLRTPPGSVVLNSTWFYHPASLAGRPIYNGYSYFTWSYGYNQVARENSAISIYASPDLTTACRQLQAARISYVELSKSAEGFIHPNYELWDSLPAVYTNPSTNLKIYSVNDICPK